MSAYLSGEARMLSQEQFRGRQFKLIADTRVQKKPYELHAHDFFEIEYVYGGSGYQMLNGTRHTLQLGSIYLLTPMDVHEICPEPILNHYNVMFSEEYFSDEFAYDMLLSCHSVQIELNEADQRRVRALFDQLVAESGRSPDEYSLSYMRSLVQCLLITLLRCNPAAAAPQPDIQRVRNALFYLQRHFREPLTLESVAAYVHLSPNYFCSLFRQATGARFSDYINTLRAHCAHRLLTTGNSPITDVCFQSGFHSFATFSRAFKKIYRQTPSQLRSKKERTMSSNSNAPSDA